MTRHPRRAKTGGAARRHVPRGDFVVKRMRPLVPAPTQEAAPSRQRVRVGTAAGGWVGGEHHL